MTKEELRKAVYEIVERTYVVTECSIMDRWKFNEETRQKLRKLEAEFERYIDVLEPLKQRLTVCSLNVTAREYCTYVIQTLNVEHRFDCDAVVKMLKRACDLTDKPKEPDEWKSPQAQEAILKYELRQGQYQPRGITQKVTIQDANKIDTHYLTFINGTLVDYTLEGKTAKGTNCCQHGYISTMYCPHCGKEIG